MNHSRKASSQFFKAHGNSTIIFDFHKKALYQMTLFIMMIIAIPRIHRIFLGRDTVFCSTVRNILTILHRTIHFIRKNRTFCNV